MMGIWKSLAGIYTVEITAASPTDTLTAINTRGINVFNVVYIDDLRVRVSIYRFSYYRFAQCLTKRNEKWEIIEKVGLYWTIQSLYKRPVLLVGCMIFLCMALYLPTRVLFVDVSGNENITKQQIIAAAEQCGIVFGASRRQVRSEKIKNALLSAIPQLQWVGVNTTGCVAVISVQEGSSIQMQDSKHTVSSIVAARDGVIESITVLRGNALCKTGQAVKQGQTLVSGYTDCGIYIKAEAANAEIYANTMRVLNVVSPAYYAERGTGTKTINHYSFRIGKNIIKFCKDSGISGSKYVKMYKEEVLTLPGGFQLPLALMTEQFIYYDDTQDIKEVSEETIQLNEKANAYLLDQMIAGSIQHSRVSVELSDDVYRLVGYYSCLEEIGRVRSEENIQRDG